MSSFGQHHAANHICLSGMHPCHLYADVVAVAGTFRSPITSKTNLLRAAVVCLQEPPVEGTVDIVRYKAGYERARTEQDLQQLFK